MEFTTQYDAALAAWDAKHSHSVAYIMPLVDMVRAYQTLSSYVWLQTPTAKYTCESS